MILFNSFKFYLILIYYSRLYVTIILIIINLLWIYDLYFLLEMFFRFLKLNYSTNFIMYNYYPMYLRFIFYKNFLIITHLKFYNNSFYNFARTSNFKNLVLLVNVLCLINIFSRFFNQK